MKNILYISIILMLASCGPTESLVVKPQYTTTNSIYSVNIGMSESEVIKTLGLEPYDITYNLSKNTKVLVWKYKRPYHEITKNSKGKSSSLHSGSERYQDDLKLLAHFSNGRLIRFYTDSGVSDSQKLFNYQYNLKSVTK